MNITNQTDGRDSRATLTATARDARAENIREKHEAAMQSKQGAIDGISRAITDAFDIAKMVEAARAEIGPQFAKWWREHDLPVGWAARYLKLAKTAGRNTLGDKDQLRLIGVLPEAEDHNDQQGRRVENPFAWTKQIGKIKRSFTVQSIGRMTALDREMAMRQLEPLIEVYRTLEALTVKSN